MRLNEEVESVEEIPDGGVVANLESKKRISGDALLYAVGRQGNVDELEPGGRRPRGRLAAAASRWMPTTAPSSRTSSPWAT